MKREALTLRLARVGAEYRLAGITTNEKKNDPNSGGLIQDVSLPSGQLRGRYTTATPSRSIPAVVDSFGGRYYVQP